jgi:hypothetical protein
MGSGKTSWSILHINESPFENVLYITPFLNEVERIIENTNRDFKQPSYKGGTKLQNLNELLACQYDIASTHELFKKLTDESREYIQNGHYTLILDEVLSAIDPYDEIKKDDMKLLQDSGCISIDEDGFVIWNQDKADYDTQYNRIKILAENKSLLYVNQKLLLWRYPPEIFTLFDNVYILTYLFDASILKNYFDLYHIQYTKKSIVHENDKYVLSDFYIPDTKKYSPLIDIYNGKLNINFEQKQNGLSSTWFKVQSKTNAKAIQQIKKNLNNYFRNILEARSDTIMWTSFKDYQSKLRGKGYSKEFKTEQLKEIDNAYGFLACNARATNKYAECYNLAYCVNIYLHPAISQFFYQKGIKVDEDLYGLSEMIQWIWRSRIRNGEKINIYIPSVRMRTLLKSWLDMSLEYQNEKVA